MNISDLGERALRLHDLLRETSLRTANGVNPDLLLASALILVAEQLEKLREDLRNGSLRPIVTIENTDYPIGVKVVPK